VGLGRDDGPPMAEVMADGLTVGVNPSLVEDVLAATTGREVRAQVCLAADEAPDLANLHMKRCCHVVHQDLVTDLVVADDVLHVGQLGGRST